MVFIRFVAFVLGITLISLGESQLVSSDSPRSGSGSQELPFFGNCDRIAMKGVMNCAENFLPNRLIFDEGLTLCCAYGKYKACITGLYDGLRASMESQRCPKSYSTQTIMTFGQNVIGFLPRLLCERNDGKSSCQPTTNSGSELENEP